MPNIGNHFQTAKTHCPVGHEYTAENTKLCKSTRPGFFKRQCRACKNELTIRTRARERLLNATTTDDTNAAACDHVLQTLEAIRAQELAARDARKIVNRAARKIRDAAAQNERNRKRRDQHRAAASDPVENIEMAQRAKEQRGAMLAQIAGGGVENTVRADFVEAQDDQRAEVRADPDGDESAYLQAIAAMIGAVDSERPAIEAPAIQAPAPIARAPRRPRPFKRLAIRFCDWRDQQEYRQRQGAQEHISREPWQAPR